MNIDNLKSELLDIRIFCGRHFPFIIIPLSYARIIISKQIPTVGVNQKGHIIINPTWWSTLNTEFKRFVIVHECLHNVLCHPFRAHQFNPQLYNICSDGKVNYAIVEANIQGITYHNNDLITLNSLTILTKLHIADLQKMSTEEITKTLENNQDTNRQKNSLNNLHQTLDGFGDDLLRGDFEGEILQEGEPILNSSSVEGLEVAWRGVCEKAKTFAKQAGVLPASFERLICEVLEVKPPWQTVLRFGLQGSFVCDSSFTYPNRRNTDLPGQAGCLGTVWCLVDTSGSIKQDLLKVFLGIAKHEARQASLRVVAWDTNAYEVLRAERPCEVARKIVSKMKGGGGTICLPVLQKVYKLMSPNDAIIVLTDGDIYDVEKEETKDQFHKIANKARFCLIGYTHKPVHAPGFKSVFIKL